MMKCCSLLLKIKSLIFTGCGDDDVSDSSFRGIKIQLPLTHTGPLECIFFSLFMFSTK